MTGLQKTGIVYLTFSTLTSGVFTILLQMGGQDGNIFFVQFPILQYCLLILGMFAYFQFKSRQSRKNPDKKSMGRIYKDYIRQNHPELFKKLYPLGAFSYNAHFLAMLRDKEACEDDILIRFMAYQKRNMLLLVWSFLIAFGFTALNSI